MDKDEVPKGSLQALLDEEGGGSDPEPGPSDVPTPEQSSSDGYWLAQYFTKPKQNLGISVMGLKYPLHWPKEKAEKAAREVMAGDKFAYDIPLSIKKESDLITLLLIVYRSVRNVKQLIGFQTVKSHSPPNLFTFKIPSH